jgi:hypothetical protein
MESQEVRDAKNMEHLSIKGTDSRQSQPKGMAMWSATGKAIGWGCPRSWELVSGHHMPARHKSVRFNVCPAGFWSCFGLIPPFYVPIPPFWNGHIYFVSLYLGSV